jgi:hypothetical protein
MEDPMNHRTLLLPALALGIGLQLLAGCQQNDHADRSDRMDATTQPSTRAAAAMNARSVDSLLAEAEHSEAKGDYSHAMEVYQSLRSFPEASRPKDLDQRVNALQQKMQSQPR